MKWFLSTIIGCIVAALFFVLPIFFGSLHLMIFTGDFNFDFGWEYLLEMLGMFGISLWFVGRGLKKYHPPLAWSNNRNQTILIIVNFLLILSPAYYVYSLLTVEYYYFFGLPMLSQLLSLPSLFLLILLNKKITNENLDMAELTPEPEEQELPKDYQRRIRITVVIMSLAMMISIFFVVHSKIEADLANEQLDIERRWHKQELNELYLKIDSLSTKLETLKLKNDTISYSR